jgi:hypothetical protein
LPIAIDGSKFKTVNNRDKNFTRGKIASRIAHLEASVDRYLKEMVRIDWQEEGEARAEKIANLAQRTGRIRQEIQRLQDMDRVLKVAPDSQISLTDPDVRSMATSARGVVLWATMRRPRRIWSARPIMQKHCNWTTQVGLISPIGR